MGTVLTIRTLDQHADCSSGVTGVPGVLRCPAPARICRLLRSSKKEFGKIQFMYNWWIVSQLAMLASSKASSKCS